MKKVSFKPIAGNILPRFAGIASFMRLPIVDFDHDAIGDVDIGLIGVPWDGGTTNRPGARHGPRQMREQSCLMRNVHPTFHIKPYQNANCADLGDVPVNPADNMDCMNRIEKFYNQVVDRNIIPLSAGGDHLISLPILKALAKKHGPMGMVHFDAHTDTWDRYFGDFIYTHGTPFRRAIEEGYLDPKRIVQIGIRGGLYAADDKEWGDKQGIRVIEIEEYFKLGPDKTMEIAKQVIGNGKTYISFDVDGIDPTYTPGTGTPEIGGYTSAEAQAMIRHLRGCNLVGGDVVEVSPPFDPSGLTALVGVTIMWEILCMLSEQIAKK